MTDPNHIAEARKKVSRPQIREAFLRNGAVIPADRDDLPDYVYEAAFELLEIAAAPPVSSTVAGRTYLSGPMTGLPDFNFPAFNAAAEKLRAEGLHVENPAEMGVIDGWEWADYLRVDLAMLVTCETIAMLPGWSKSKGALLEHHVAVALGMSVRHLEGAESLQDACAAIAAEFKVPAGLKWPEALSVEFDDCTSFTTGSGNEARRRAASLGIELPVGIDSEGGSHD